MGNILDKRKTIFSKSKLMEEKILLKKLLLLTNISNNRFVSIKFLIKIKLLMLLVLLKVRDLKVLLLDGVLDIFKKNHIEVTEKKDVLVLGIHLVLHGLLLELVKMVISIELKLIKKYIEWEKEKEMEPKIVQQHKLISHKKILLLWEVSLIMVL